MSTTEASRRSPLHDRWALQVKERAGWKCEGCGMPVAAIRKLGGTLEAAHILPHSEFPDDRYKLENGKALCTFRNRRHPKGLGNGYGCHNAMSGHWGHAYGTMPAHHAAARMHHVHTHRRLRHEILASWALLAAGILWAQHLTLWGWGALGLSLLLWPALGISTAIWLGLLALNLHLHHDPAWRPYTLGTPSTFGGWLAWMAELLGAWLACLWGTATALAHRLPGRVAGFLWGWVRR